MGWWYSNVAILMKILQKMEITIANQQFLMKMSGADQLGYSE